MQGSPCAKLPGGGRSRRVSALQPATPMPRRGSRGGGGGPRGRPSHPFLQDTGRNAAHTGYPITVETVLGKAAVAWPPKRPSPAGHVQFHALRGKCTQKVSVPVWFVKAGIDATVPGMRRAPVRLWALPRLRRPRVRPWRIARHAYCSLFEQEPPHSRHGARGTRKFLTRNRGARGKHARKNCSSTGLNRW